MSPGAYVFPPRAEVYQSVRDIKLKALSLDWKLHHRINRGTGRGFAHWIEPDLTLLPARVTIEVDGPAPCQPLIARQLYKLPWHRGVLFRVACSLPDHLAPSMSYLRHCKFMIGL